MGGAPGVESLFIWYLTRNRGNVTRRVYLLSSCGQQVGGGQWVREVHRKLKLHSWVN
jgi:hypothetical protein